MSISTSVHLVIGVRASDVQTVVVTEVVEPRFDPKTGKPIAPETIRTEKIGMFGREVDPDERPYDWTCSALKGTGLEAFCPSYYPKDDYSVVIIGREPPRLHERSQNFTALVEDVQVRVDVAAALRNLGCTIEPRMFLVVSTG